MGCSRVGKEGGRLWGGRFRVSLTCPLAADGGEKCRTMGDREKERDRKGKRKRERKRERERQTEREREKKQEKEKERERERERCDIL